MSDTTEKQELTLENIERALRESVEERGREYTYPAKVEVPGKLFAIEDDYHFGGGACRYLTPDGTPACIIGLALTKLGWHDDLPTDGSIDAMGLLIDLGVRANSSRYVDPLLNAVQAAQSIQDEGGTWGEALEAFVTTIDEAV